MGQQWPAERSPTGPLLALSCSSGTQAGHLPWLQNRPGHMPGRPSTPPEMEPGAQPLPARAAPGGKVARRRARAGCPLTGLPPPVIFCHHVHAADEVGPELLQVVRLGQLPGHAGNHHLLHAAPCRATQSAPPPSRRLGSARLDLSLPAPWRPPPPAAPTPPTPPRVGSALVQPALTSRWARGRPTTALLPGACPAFGGLLQARWGHRPSA